LNNTMHSKMATNQNGDIPTAGESKRRQTETATSQNKCYRKRVL